MTYFLGHRAELVGEGLCTLQGMTQQFFELASVLWTVVIGLTLWSSVVRQVKMENRAAMHGFAWGTSFIIMLLPLSTDSYGPAGSWCWIKDKMPGTVWRYIVFYVPLWLAFAWNTYSYTVVTKAIKNFATMSKSGDQQRKLQKLATQLRWYPMILVAAWTIPTISRIYNSLAPGKPLYWLTIMHCLSRGLQGILNAVAYGLTPSVKERWASLRRKVIEENSCNSLCATGVLADDNDTEELQTGESSTAPNPLQEDEDEETAVSTKETEMS